MNKLPLIIILTVISPNTIAEWIEFTEGQKGTHTVYVDPNTIHKDSDKVKMWILLDYKKAQELAYLPLYMSIKRQSKFNCKEKYIKKLYISYHSKQMGGGKVIYSDNAPDNWTPVSFDTIDMKLWKYVCSK